MTGSQLRHWRTNHDLTLRQLAEQLGGVVHFSTITGWETAENGTKEIPEWATEKILATTQVTLPLNELHHLLDAAREDNMPAQDMIAKAIHEWLERRRSQAETPEVIERQASLESVHSGIAGGNTRFTSLWRKPDSLTLENTARRRMSFGKQSANTTRRRTLTAASLSSASLKFADQAELLPDQKL